MKKILTILSVFFVAIATMAQNKAEIIVWIPRVTEVNKSINPAGF